MRRLLLILLTCAATLGIAAPQARAAPCGLPDAHPFWVDFASGSVSFRYWVFGKPGVIAATEGGPTVPKKLRSYNAKTVFWQMRLGDLAGSTSKPADPRSIPAAAAKLVAKAQEASACPAPVIALNELNGAGTTTPWSATNAQYRANVLELLRQITARGGRPFLLLASGPYTAGAAGDWWRQAAEVADLVPEIYFSGPAINRQGPIAGSRAMRRALRQAMRNFTSLGIPASRLGFALGFQSTPGGRSGLQPASAWYEVVKLEAQASRQVAGELGLGSVWSWGWGTFSADKSGDEEKKTAACVYLWTRDPALCDAPSVAGPDFDASLTEGQLELPPTVQCAYEDRAIAGSDVAALALVTGDPDVAATTLLQRLVEQDEVPATTVEVLAAERVVVDVSFHGGRSQYLAALAAAHASLPVARGLLGDLLRRQRLEQRMVVPDPPATDLATFYGAYPNAPMRRVRATLAPWWLGAASSGFVLQAAAPARVFAAPTGATLTLAGDQPVTVEALGDPIPVGAVPFAVARPALRVALQAFARGDAFDRWAQKRQEDALQSTTCVHDDLPEVAAVDVGTYLPFLDLRF